MTNANIIKQLEKEIVYVGRNLNLDDVYELNGASVAVCSLDLELYPVDFEMPRMDVCKIAYYAGAYTKHYNLTNKNVINLVNDFYKDSAL